MKRLVAVVKNRYSNEGLEIIERDYPTKADFANDLRGNGYSIQSIQTKAHFEWCSLHAEEKWQLTPTYYKRCIRTNGGKPLDYLDYMKK